MARSRTSARKAGSSFERAVADFLRDRVSPYIDRRVKTGALDRGDIANLRINGRRCVVECKDYGGKHRLPKWLDEAEAERENDGAEFGVVVWKRLGTRKPEEQYVTMTLGTFAEVVRACNRTATRS